MSRNQTKFGSFTFFCSEVIVNDRLSQDKAGRLILGGRVLKTKAEIEVIVGGNWHRAIVFKTQGRWDLVLDTGREIGAVGLIARLVESKSH